MKNKIIFILSKIIRVIFKMIMNEVLRLGIVKKKYIYNINKSITELIYFYFEESCENE